VTRVFSNLTELRAAVGTDLGHSAWLEIDHARHRRTLRRRTHRGLHRVRDFGRSGRPSHHCCAATDSSGLRRSTIRALASRQSDDEFLDGAAARRLAGQLPQEPVERVLRSRDEMLGSGSGAVDVALRGHHRLVPEQLHQGVYADVLVGQSGGELVAQTVDEHTAGALTVHTGLLERAQHPVLQGSAGDPLSVAAGRVVGVQQQGCR
jgi:hypothetical protein